MQEKHTPQIKNSTAQASRRAFHYAATTPGKALTITEPVGFRFVSTRTVHTDTGRRIETSRWNLSADDLSKVEGIAAKFEMTPRAFLCGWSRNELRGQGSARNGRSLAEGVQIGVRRPSAFLRAGAAHNDQTPAEYVMAALTTALEKEFVEGSILHPVTGDPLMSCVDIEKLRTVSTKKGGAL